MMGIAWMDLEYPMNSNIINTSMLGIQKAYSSIHLPDILIWAHVQSNKL